MNDRFFYELNGDNWFETSTISLFEEDNLTAKLIGLNAHFHAPSEHSIDGNLMDLELHVVHGLEIEKS